MTRHIVDRPVVLLTLEGEGFDEGKIPDTRYSIVTPSGWRHTIERDPDFILDPENGRDLWPVEEKIEEAVFTCPICEDTGPHPHGWYISHPNPKENPWKWCVVQCKNCRAFHWFELRGTPK